MASRSKTKVMPTSTPKRQTASAPPVTESPGNWTHPRLKEITRRRNATTFTDKNVRRITYNVVALIVLWVLQWLGDSIINSDLYVSNPLALPGSFFFFPIESDDFFQIQPGVQNPFFLGFPHPPISPLSKHRPRPPPSLPHRRRPLRHPPHPKPT